MDKEKEIYTKKLSQAVQEEINLFLNTHDIVHVSDSSILLEYIQLLLKEASISNAISLYYYSLDKEIPSKYIDNLIMNIHNLFSFILDRQKNKGNTLAFTEIAENYDVWAADAKLLNNLVTKIFFISKCLVNYFAVDMRWVVAIGDIMYLLPRVVLLFTDVRTYQQNDPLQNASFYTVSKTFELLIAIFQWSADNCLKIYAMNHDQEYWCFRGINILFFLGNLHILQRTPDKRKEILERIDVVRNRMRIEQKGNKNKGKLTAALSTMPLEELLKIDSNYHK